MTNTEQAQQTQQNVQHQLRLGKRMLLFYLRSLGYAKGLCMYLTPSMRQSQLKCVCPNTWATGFSCWMRFARSLLPAAFAKFG